MQLKKEQLIFISKKGKETVYDLRWLKKPQLTSSGFEFIYGEIPSKVCFICKDKNTEWYELIVHAKEEIYPQIHKPISLDEYILNNFNLKTRAKAIQYYKDMAGLSLSESMKKVDQLLL